MMKFLPEYTVTYYAPTCILLHTSVYRRITEQTHVVLMMTPLMDSAKEKSTALSKR